MSDTAIRNHPYLLSLLVQAHKEVGEIRIRDKSSSWVWRLVPRPWRECITVVGKTIWFPGGHNLHPSEYHLLVITHEVVHLVQKKELGRLRFYAKYLSPQIALVIAAALFAIPLLGVAGLLIPWPSPWRAEIEEQAYATESWLAWKLGRDSSQWRNWLKEALESNIYWGMSSTSRIWGFANEVVIDIWVRGNLTKANPTVLGFAQRAFDEWQKKDVEGKGETNESGSTPG